MGLGEEAGSSLSMGPLVNPTGGTQGRQSEHSRGSLLSVLSNPVKCIHAYHGFYLKCKFLHGHKANIPELTPASKIAARSNQIIIQLFLGFLRRVSMFQLGCHFYLFPDC